MIFQKNVYPDWNLPSGAKAHQLTNQLRHSRDENQSDGLKFVNQNLFPSTFLWLQISNAPNINWITFWKTA